VTSSEAQLASYFARYDPATAKFGRALRKRLRARLPGLNEIVYLYENQESLVIAFSPNDTGYGALCSLVLRPTGAQLYFSRGPELSKSDPHGLLQGRGKAVRFLALASVADFERPEVQNLIAAVLALTHTRLDPTAKGVVIVKAEEQKKRTAKSAARKSKPSR